MSEEDDRAGFLARWSQRKREAVRHTPEPEAPDETAAPDEQSDVAPLDLSTLPSVDDLTHESDLAAFLQKGVPDHLRNAALRRMWEIDPAVRDYVGDALDYAWDWNVPGGVPGNGELSAAEVKDIAARFFAQDSVLAEAPPEPETKNVIEHVASQQSDRTPAESVEASRPAQVSADSKEPLSLKNQAELDVDAAGTDTVDAAASQRKPRRHGGAAPMASPKV